MSTTKPAGRGYAKTGLVIGGFISVVANIAHSFVPPGGAPADWHPHTGAVASAMMWPILLFIVIEIFARVAWPTGWVWNVLRWAALPPVALVAALVSYRHLSGLLAFYGEERIIVILGPIAIDGCMLIATGALVATGHGRTQPHPDGHDQAVTTTPASQPRAATTTAITTTTTPAPILQPATVSTGAVTVPAAAPAVRQAPAPRPAPPVAPTAPVTTAARTAAIPARTTTLAAPTNEQADTTHRHDTVPPVPAQAPAPFTRDIPVDTVHGAPPLKSPAPAALLTRARHLADAYRQETGNPISKGPLSARLRVDTDTAEQLLAVLNLDANQPPATGTAVNGTPAAALIP